MLSKLKIAVEPYIVRTADLTTDAMLQAVLWMVLCELQSSKQPITTTADLDISNTMVSTVLEASEVKIDAVPKNFGGNAFVVSFISSNGLDCEQMTLPQLCGRLAETIAKEVANLKSDPQLAAQRLLRFYELLQGASSRGSDRVLLGSANCQTGVPVSEIDLGNGPPVVAPLIVTLPMRGRATTIVPGVLRDDSVFVNMQLQDGQLDAIRNSVVLKELTPGFKILSSDITEEDMHALISGAK